MQLVKVEQDRRSAVEELSQCGDHRRRGMSMFGILNGFNTERKATMTKFIVSAKKFIANEDAPTMVEYGLLVALIALVVAAAASTLGTKLSGMFTNASNSV
jgi:pilus assembly protein Flp/PilA